MSPLNPHKSSRRRKSSRPNVKNNVCGNINYQDTLDKLLSRLASIEAATLGHSDKGKDVQLPGLESTRFGSGDTPQAATVFDQPTSPNKDPEVAVNPVHQSNSAPSNSLVSLHKRWMALLPSLLPEYMAYMSASCAKTVQAAPSKLTESCPAHCKSIKSSNILCLFYDHCKHVTITTCPCRPVQAVLVRNGLFPASPSQTRIAVSIDLIDYGSSLFQHACDAVNAQAHALNSFYFQRGFYLLNDQGHKFKEPFRKSLGSASQWLGTLKDHVKQRVEVAVEKAEDAGNVLLSSNSNPLGSDSSTTSTSPNSEVCSRFLRQLCPACFNLSSFGQTLDRGGDFHIATDGNFHHRHAAKAGPGVPFHEPRHIIPKEFVDRVGEKIDQVRKKAPRTQSPAKVPSQALDECERSYEAAQGDKKKATRERYDEYGLMSLVCRHDVPLFFAVIDTPGEKQKFSVALILWFLKHVPASANFVVFYDIGCVLDRSTDKYDIFPQGVKSRIRFATTAMHAYGHQWSCQLVYNPRLCRGLGKSECEGVERVWSRMHKLIALVRSSSVARKLWMTDTFIAFVALDAREQLGPRLKRQLRNVKKELEKTKCQIDSTGLSVEHLRRQWALQQDAQLTMDSRRPFDLNKKLDQLQDIQAKIDEIETQQKQGVKSANVSLRSGRPITKTIRAYDSLESKGSELVAKQEELYASIHVQFEGAYPLLKDLAPEFRTTLIRALVLKFDIRRQAIQILFDHDRLDQSAAGKNQPLGTKAHQTLRNTISTSSPILKKHIKTYNEYCKRLTELHDQSKWKVPLPKELPLTIQELRSSHSALWQDVEWQLTGDQNKTPAWMEDPNTRRGIHALLPFDRCSEEMQRLPVESDNMSRWFLSELLATEIAIRLPQNRDLLLPLTQRRDRILQLRGMWEFDLIPSSTFDAHVQNATLIANTFCDTHCRSITHNHDATSTGGACAAPQELEFLKHRHRISVPHYSVSTATPNTSSSFSHDEEDAIHNNGDWKTASCCQEEDVRCYGLPSDRMDTLCHDYALYMEDEEVYRDMDGSCGESLVWEEGTEMDCVEDESMNWDDPIRATILTAGNVQLEQRDLIDSSLPNFVLSFPSDHIRSSLEPHMSQIRRQTALSEATLRLLRNPDGRLNDLCINDCAYLLQLLLLCQPTFDCHARRCALFTTYDLIRGSHLTEKALWKHVRGTQFWDRDIWIVPIHRPLQEHWVLCIGYPKHNVMYLFDSFGNDDVGIWVEDLQAIHTLFARLAAIAPEQGSQVGANEWRIKIAMNSPVQFNNHDCGLWVLLWIFSTLRGYRECSTKLGEDFIPVWRTFLVDLVHCAWPSCDTDALTSAP